VILVKLGVLRLVRYESWICSLGYDREYLVQARQHELLRELHRRGAAIGAFAIPLTYDLAALILNSVRTKDYVKVVEDLSSISPVPLKAMIGRGDTYPKALSNAMELEAFTYPELEEPTAAVHVDLNGYYDLLEREGAYRAYEVVTSLAEKLRRLAFNLGGLATYMGGDNVLAFLPIEAVDSFVARALAEDDVKVGVGVAPTPRRAVALSTEALAAIRRRDVKRRSLKLVLGVAQRDG